MVDLHYPYMIIKIFVYNLTFALCLYQLSTNPANISRTRVLRLLCEFICVATIFFYLCHCSERLDNCNAKLRTAVISSDWWKFSPQVRRTLIMLLRRVKKPNHFQLVYRTQVIDYAFYVGVAKLSFSFVNFMHISTRY